LSIVDDISYAFGYQDAFAGIRDSDGIIASGGKTYRYVCVVKGGDKTYYDGADSLEEANEQALDIIRDSTNDPDGEGVWAVIAVIDTKNREVIYPQYEMTLATGYKTSLDSLI